MFNKISRLLKQKKVAVITCNHEYELLKKVEKEVLYGHRDFDTYTVEDIYIYCPKCRVRKKVTPLEWELIQKEQAIDTKYMKKHKVVLP